MPSDRVTITDLSRVLKLSTCTISKILNRSFKGVSYSEETIRRVEATAKKMGYTANVQARGLRTRKTMLIGFLLPTAQVSLFAALTDQLELELREYGYQVVTVHSHNDPDTEPLLIRSLQSRGIDGLLWIPCRDKVNLTQVDLNSNLPVVILDRPLHSRGIPFVATDNRSSARELAQKIFELGHRKITVLNAPEGDRSLRERFNGIRDIFKANALQFQLANETAQAKEMVMQHFKDSKNNTSTALIALSETLAIGALMALRDLRITIPKDLSFASFDDFPLASHWTPRLTAISQNIEKLASEAVALLLQRMQNPDTPHKNIRVPATLQWRRSVGKR